MAETASLLSFNWRRPCHQVVALWLLSSAPGNFIPRKSLPFFFSSSFSLSVSLSLFSPIHGPLGKFQRNAGGPDSLYCIWSWLDAHMQDQQAHRHYWHRFNRNGSMWGLKSKSLQFWISMYGKGRGEEGGGGGSLLVTMRISRVELFLSEALTRRHTKLDFNLLLLLLLSGSLNQTVWASKEEDFKGTTGDL